MEESVQERQENEKAVLSAIYGDQVSFITQENSDDWSPIDCVLTLKANDEKISKKIDSYIIFHIRCSDKYPDQAPTLKFDKVKGVSKENANILLVELIELSLNLRGEVMIYELAQHVEKYLDNYNYSGYESFYEQMVSRKQLENEMELQLREEIESKKREEILSMRQSKEQALKKAHRRRRLSTRISDEQVDTEEEVSPHKDSVPRSLDVRTRETIRTHETSQVESCDTDELLNYCQKGNSRFESEFEHIKWLGQGSFGDVIEVRNRLDDGFYAVKRIPLNPVNKQLNKKITREVKLLSRLYHENVVRYYNSWIEEFQKHDGNVGAQDIKNDDVKTMLPFRDNSNDWAGTKTTVSTHSVSSDDEDSWISFRYDIEKDEVDNICFDETSVLENNQPITSSLCLYIQMELCDKSTLRSAIDEGLYEDMQRVWRLFREIVEGLCHIHQQGIMHRDLKPVNIFLDSEDHVKIGDFGLATSCIFLKKNAETSDVTDSANLIITGRDLSHSGQVGTALYVAPEVNTPAKFKIHYNQSVDIYSLGITFFEMCYRPINTKMEQYTIISELRDPKVKLPSDFNYDAHSPQALLITSMLNHDVKARPTAQELIQSKFIPPPQLEEAQMKEMVRRALANPQSKHYKHLIASCFEQVTPLSTDATFDLRSGRTSLFLLHYEAACEKFRKVFRRHGAISFHPPLFSPAKNLAEPSVTLMTRWGGLVNATFDLRTPFARYLAHNPDINIFKRYVIDKIYRERRVLGLHPKELYECSFDIVSPLEGNLNVETESLQVMWELINEFPALLEKKLYFRLNHIFIINSIFDSAGLPSGTKEAAILEICKAKSESRTKAEFECLLRGLSIPEHSINFLLNALYLENNVYSIKPQLLSLIKGDHLESACKQALEELGSVISYCCSLGIRGLLNICTGVIENMGQYSGLIWELILEERTPRDEVKFKVLANGGRYDSLVHNYRQVLALTKEGTQCVAGFTISLDTFISVTSQDEQKPNSIDVLICLFMREQTCASFMDTLLPLLRDLWLAGIRTSYLSTQQTLDEIQSYCQEQYIPHIVFFKEHELGVAKVRSWTKERFIEKKVTVIDLLDFLLKSVKISESTGTCKATSHSRSPSEPTILITFISLEKINQSTKRRYECAIFNSIQSTLAKLSPKAKVEVFAANLSIDQLKYLSYIIDTGSELGEYTKRYPGTKKYAQKVFETFNSRLKTDPTVKLLYSLPDNVHTTFL